MSLAPIKSIDDNSGIASYGSDENLIVQFESKAVHMAYKSEQEGRAIYENVDYIKIMFPGDRNKVIFRPVDHNGNQNVPADTKRFIRQWQAYQNNKPQEIEGTPLSEWPPMTPADVASFYDMKIRTIEQLASLPDVNLTWMGARHWRDKAAVWLENAKDGAVVMKLQKQIDDLANKLEVKDETIKDLNSKLSKKDEKDDKTK